METRTLQIEGMSCGHCVSRVTRTLASLPGVSVEDVTVGTARVRFDPAQVDIASIGAALDDVGFALKTESPASG
jgi:copper chaperone